MNCPFCNTSNAYISTLSVECCNPKCWRYVPTSLEHKDVLDYKWFIKETSDKDSEISCFYIDENDGLDDKTIFGVHYRKIPPFAVDYIFVSQNGFLYKGTDFSLPMAVQYNTYGIKKSRWSFVKEYHIDDFFENQVLSIINILKKNNWAR